MCASRNERYVSPCSGVELVEEVWKDVEEWGQSDTTWFVGRRARRRTYLIYLSVDGTQYSVGIVILALLPVLFEGKCA